MGIIFSTSSNLWIIFNNCIYIKTQSNEKNFFNLNYSAWH